MKKVKEIEKGPSRLVYFTGSISNDPIYDMILENSSYIKNEQANFSLPLCSSK